MSEAFLSEIRIMAFNFPPKGWAFCNGQLLPINQNQALFALIGTTYGGDGRTTFALPNLQGRTPVHAGAGFTLGQPGGEVSHTLSTAEVPAHTHAAAGTTSSADSIEATSNYLGAAQNMYGPAANLTAMNPSTISPAGGGQAHSNLQPNTALNFCIALTGIFPSQN